MRILTALLFALMIACSANGQTATVTTSHCCVKTPYDGVGAGVHLAWGPPSSIPAGWTLIDYCIADSDVSGHEHDATTQGGIVYKGCTGHYTETQADVYPFTGPRFWVVWAELMSTDGTKVALTADSNEASCDFEVLSQTATLITFYCKGQIVGPPVIAPATGVTVTVQ